MLLTLHCLDFLLSFVSHHDYVSFCCKFSQIDLSPLKGIISYTSNHTLNLLLLLACNCSFSSRISEVPRAQHTGCGILMLGGDSWKKWGEFVLPGTGRLKMSCSDTDRGDMRRMLGQIYYYAQTQMFPKSIFVVRTHTFTFRNFTEDRNFCVCVWRMSELFACSF